VSADGFVSAPGCRRSTPDPATARKPAHRRHRQPRRGPARPATAPRARTRAVRRHRPG
jgi:hypothetical protein